jgi:hypothetical protein
MKKFFNRIKEYINREGTVEEMYAAYCATNSFQPDLLTPFFNPFVPTFEEFKRMYDGKGQPDKNK